MQIHLPSKRIIELEGITYIDDITYIEIPDVYITPSWGFKIYYGKDYKIFSYDSLERATIDHNCLISYLWGFAI